MDLETRMGMLISSKTISENVASVVRKIIHRLDNYWKISLTEENGGRMVTHLAMTLMRANRAGTGEILECENIDTVKKLNVFPMAMEITEDLITHTGISITDTEKEFLQTNICLLLEDK